MKPVDSIWQGIESVALRAFDSLRPFLDAHRAARHVEALFFLKLIADIGSAFSESQRSSISETTPAWSAVVFSRGDHTWNDILSFGPDIARILDDAILIAGNKNHALRGAFSNISFHDISKEISNGPGILTRLVDLVSAADFRPWILEGPRALGEIFEHLTSILLERLSPEFGEFSVPPDVAKLIAEIMNPTSDESILDPVCGSGRLLSALARHVGLKHGPFAGQDWRTTALSLCQMNLFAHGISARIEAGDALHSPLRDKSGNFLKADVVIGNPPFGSRISLSDNLLEERPELLLRGLNNRIRSEYAFVAHILEVAREGTGRAAAIVPQGLLFRQEEQAIRRRLVEENILVGVLVLPPNLFTHTKISVAVLIFNKSKKSKGVLFIDASRSFVVSGRLNSIPSHELERIVSAFRNFQDIPGFCRVATAQEIQDNNFQFSVTRYVPQERPEREDMNFEQIGKAISDTESELDEVRREIDILIEALG